MWLLIADLSGRALVRLGHGQGPAVAGARRSGTDSAVVVPFTDSAVADVLRNQRVASIPAPDGWRVLAPMTQRGEVIGLLELFMPVQPDTAQLELIRRAAHILAFVVIANRRHTDLFEWGQRTASFELSVETQQQLATLRELRCGRAQGFYLGKPMAADSMIQLVEHAPDGLIP